MFAHLLVLPERGELLPGPREEGALESLAHPADVAGHEGLGQRDVVRVHDELVDELLAEAVRVDAGHAGSGVKKGRAVVEPAFFFFFFFLKTN